MTAGDGVEFARIVFAVLLGAAVALLGRRR